MSHPVWVCGLKLHIKEKGDTHRKSHPVWVCGLKQNVVMIIFIVTPVTPCMGVWIETVIINDSIVKMGCHTLYGCVD